MMGNWVNIFCSSSFYMLFATMLLGSLPANAQNTIDDSSLHPGVASTWAVGHHLLAAGDIEEAHKYLNYAYSVLPEVELIALDYQEVLVRGGFIKEAVKVLDKLISSNPDSMQWYVRRSSLNLRVGELDEALYDLVFLRNKGHSSAQLLETEALIYATKGKEKKAMSTYRLGLEKYPDEAVELYMGMIQIYQRKGNAAAILGICEEAISALPREPIFHEMKLRSYIGLGRHPEALQSAKESDADLLLNGTVEDSFLLQLADIYVQGDQLTRAIAILADEEEANGLDLKPSLWLARLLLGSDQPKATTALIAKIENKWPQSPRLWFLKGKLSEEDSHWDIAVQHYEHAVEMGTNDPEILLALLRALLVSNDVELAFNNNGPEDQGLLKTLNKYTSMAVAVAPDADAEGQLVLGYAYRALSELEQAVTHFKLAANDPGYRKTALTQASICYDELGDVEQAFSLLQELYIALPEDPEVANSLGYFLTEKNMNITKAEKLVNFALKKEPGRGAFLDTKGWVLYRKGKLDDAFDYLIKAVNVLPDDPVVLEHLGIVLHEQGQLEQALDVLRRALTAGGDGTRLGDRIQEIEQQVSTSGK